MTENRVILALSNADFAKKLKILLQGNGYTVVDSANNAADCIRKVRTTLPEFVILGPNLGGMSTHSLASIIIEEKLSCVILFASDAAAETAFADFMNRYDFEIILTPINSGILLNTLYMMQKNASRMRNLEKKVTELEDSLETRKYLDIAKGILMKNFKIQEKEAHRRIQKTSMDTGMSLKDVAKAVIEKYG